MQRAIGWKVRGDSAPSTAEESIIQLKAAIKALGIPAGGGPKYLRHSMATILANRRVPPDEIALAMGHRVLPSTTEDYVIYSPDHLEGFRGGVEDVLADLNWMAGAALQLHFTRKVRQCRRAAGIEKPR